MLVPTGPAVHHRVAGAEDDDLVISAVAVHAGIAGGDSELVDVVAAVRDVVAEREELVGACAAAHRVGARVPTQTVEPCLTDEVVSARTSVEHIAPAATVNDVVAA